MAEAGVAHGARADADWEWGERFQGFRRRVLFSIVLPIAWLSFSLLYVAFWATGFTLFQSGVIVLVSALVLGGTMGAVWMWWGPSYAKGWAQRP
ncbi:MAG: hypothetical protein L3K09_00455 [Thermoplasmata archaeon]|nr:hypothetical protein [Thermoplasmata archaeon]